MSDQHKAPDIKAVRYTGAEKTRQYPGGHWLEPGEIITGKPGALRSLSELSDFEIVDTTLAPPPEELPLAEDEDEGE